VSSSKDYFNRYTDQRISFEGGTMSRSLNFLKVLTGSFASPAAENPTVAMVEAAYKHHQIDLVCLTKGFSVCASLPASCCDPRLPSVASAQEGRPPFLPCHAPALTASRSHKELTQAVE